MCYIVVWPSALETLCKQIGQNSCIFVASQPLEALLNQHFSMWPPRVSSHLIPLDGGVSKSSIRP